MTRKYIICILLSSFSGALLTFCICIYLSSAEWYHYVATGLPWKNSYVLENWNTTMAGNLTADGSVYLEYTIADKSDAIEMKKSALNYYGHQLEWSDTKIPDRECIPSEIDFDKLILSNEVYWAATPNISAEDGLGNGCLYIFNYSESTVYIYETKY